MSLTARLLLALWLLAASAFGQAAEELVSIPPLKARVTDLTGTLGRQETVALDADLAQFERKRGSQIVVLLIPTTQPETIEAYGIRVAEAWQIGRRGVEDGVIVLVARNDRALRIEVGRGLEGVLPDAVTKRIIEEVMLPRFRLGDFHGGLQDGVTRIAGIISGEPLTQPSKPGRAQGASVEAWENLLPLAMLFVFVGGGLLRALFGRLFGGALAGGVAFFGGWLLLGSVSIALLVALVVFILTLSGVAGAGGLRGLGGRGGFGGGAVFPEAEARSQVAGIKATPELINDPQAFAKFQAAQTQLSGALSRLLLVVENYPNLKADANFRDLQAQVEGTENRITVARNRYIKAVQEYNTIVRIFPSNLTAMLFGYKTKANFAVEDEKMLSAPPAVRFDPTPATR